MYNPHDADLLWQQALESASEVCKTTQLAEDAACHAFNYVMANQDKWDGRPMRNWIGIIARNKALTLRRELKRFSDGKVEDYHLTTKPTDGADHTRLHTAIGMLKPKDQEVLKMHYFDSMELKTIAELLGANESTIKVRIMRARQKLKDLL
tara:strand:+ start:10951 stop:11403 length:453 start_codon:yes stop_codon:yes gene_type:complete